MNRPFVFLDRDGTLVEDRDYAFRPEDCVLLPGVPEALQRLRDAGFGLALVTNQSGVARGYFDETDVERFHQRLRELLGAHDVVLDGVYVCPHHPDAGCSCRKPATGLVDRAGAELAVDLQESWVIGDKRSDAELGLAVGCGAIWLRAPGGDPPPEGVACARDLSQAASHVLEQLSRSSATRRR